MLVAQLAMMGNAVIDTAMAGRLTAIDLAAVGIVLGLTNLLGPARGAPGFWLAGIVSICWWAS